MVSKDIKQTFYLSSRLLLIVSQLKGNEGEKVCSKNGLILPTV